MKRILYLLLFVSFSLSVWADQALVRISDPGEIVYDVV
jgi:hypothetical protein